jgi:hypothetical protein
MRFEPTPGQSQPQPSSIPPVRASVEAIDVFEEFPIDCYPTDGIVKILVTPEMANAWLARVRPDQSRPLSRSWAQQLAERMDEGWIDTREPLQWSKSGWLQNGQHRLTGVVIRGKPTYLWFAFGLEDEAVGAIDTGRSRSRADIAALKGWDFPKLRPYTMTILLHWEQSPNPWSYPIRKRQYSPTHLLHENAERYPDLTTTLGWGSIISRASVAGGGSMWAAILLKASRLDYQQAEAFMQGVAYGTDLPSSSPALTLRNQLLTMRGGNLRVAQQERVAAVIIKGWNFWRTGQSVKRIDWRPDQDEAFPKLR